MALNIGSLTILKADSPEEHDSIAPLADLPAGAYMALRSYLFMRLVERGDDITVRAPTAADVREWHRRIGGNKRAMLLLDARFGSLVGGLAITYDPSPDIPANSRWQVSSHT